jgi:hypothetical protein
MQIMNQMLSVLHDPIKAAMLYGALTAVVNVTRAFAPNGSKTALVCDKLLAVLIDFHKLMSVPNTPEVK